MLKIDTDKSDNYLENGKRGIDGEFNIQ